MERLEDKEKYWKFSLSDLAERHFWDDYLEAYEQMLYRTSTDATPWYIIPADYKWVARTAVADIISSKIQTLDLQFPKVPEESLKQLEKAHKELKNE
jgi:polyphosphate kinase 2 (PPK2 family)